MGYLIDLTLDPLECEIGTRMIFYGFFQKDYNFLLNWIFN